jgi:predicted Fe-S protein YdhL (DUF1289 family)
MPANAPQVASPCVRTCALNQRNICIGCGRTSQEITDWRLMNDKEKQIVLDRLERLTPIKMDKR